MPVFSMTTFANDAGARTEIINANPMNANFNHVLAAMPPIGSIIPFYDFNAALTFNSSYWAYCDGSAATISGIGAQTLPDLSNRYLVGFGTEGGGDIDTAVWATAAVGNASHENTITSANLPTHTHDIAHGHADTFAVSAVALGGTTSFATTTHTHSLSAHTHSTDIGSFTSGAGSAHSHGAGTLKFQTGEIIISGTQDQLNMYDTNGNASIAGLEERAVGLGGGAVGFLCAFANGAINYYTKGGSGSTADESAHTHSIDPGSTASGGPSTDTSGTPSATGTVSVSGGVLSGAVTALGVTASGNGGFANTALSIQPRSIRVRFIMRIL